ncbi:MAG: DMT family transporter [Rubrivivax sp.]|nr:DMT family transporter [Rubrivivax sp.]
MSDEAARQRRALAAGLLLVALWGAAFSIQKVAYAAMGPGAFLFLRSFVMGCCAAGLLALRGRPLWPRLAPGEWRPFLFTTTAGPVLHIAMVTYGIHWSTAFSSSLIMSCGPVFTLILLRLMRGTRLGPRQVLGVVAAFCGVLLFMGEKLLAADWRASGGDLLLLVASLVFALYTIWVTPFVTRHGGVEVMCWTTLLASPVLMVLSAGAAWSAGYAGLAPGIWVAFFWTVVVSAFFGWMIWGHVNAVRGVARTAPLLYLVPPVAGLVAWLTVGETFGPQKMAGAALALGGVALAQLAGRAGGRV